MNQFKMSLFLPPISPVKNSATGRTVQPPTLTPYKEITLQEVYKLITSSERLKTLTETVRRAAENGDEKIYRMLKQQTLPYVTPLRCLFLPQKRQPDRTVGLDCGGHRPS